MILRKSYNNICLGINRMTRWVLDTDHVSLLQRGNPIIVSKVTAVNPSEISVTIITIVEQMYGRLDVIKRAKSKQELVTA
jgi:tRNA(fMet)-specific endonuclease VapC